MKKSKQISTELFLTVAGCFLYALGLKCFAAPHKIAPGGVSGIAILLNYLFDCPIGIFTFLFNIPFLIIIVWKKYFDKIFVVKILVASAILTCMTDYVAVLLPEYHGNALLAAMFSGAVMGVGLALVHLAKSNTGGISMMGLIIQKIEPQFHVGTLITIMNMMIVISSGIIYHNIESMLYATVTVYISGAFMDKILFSMGTKSLLLVISECTDKVKEALISKHAGFTVLVGEGGFTKRYQRVLLCVTDKHKCESLQKLVLATDPCALTIITEASKVEGKGFTPIM